MFNCNKSFFCKSGGDILITDLADALDLVGVSSVSRFFFSFCFAFTFSFFSWRSFLSFDFGFFRVGDSPSVLALFRLRDSDVIGGGGGSIISFT
jgi:hypothetical protein